MAVRTACAFLLAGLALADIQVIPKREDCAKTGVNCINQKCCQTTGYECYEVKPGDAMCMKSCTPGVDGTCYKNAPAMKASHQSDVTYAKNTLFCWAFYTQDTGSTKKSWELELLRTQLFLGASIFGCEDYRVYSDVETWISPDKVNTIKVTEKDAQHPFHFAKRKRVGKWVNSNMFIQAWRQIKDEGAWSKWDWTVKVDIDAVFLPIRLRQYLGQVEVTNNGIYLETCKYVNFGFFGSCAVVSHDAAATYMANLDDCEANLNYMSSDDKDTGNQPWGEDLFQQRCMDLHQVDKVAGYDLNTDASCAFWRPEGEKKNRKWLPDCSVTKTPAMHHFKTPELYFNCLKATQR